MTPTVKKIIIAAIILAVIFVCVLVYKRSNQAQTAAHPNRVIPPIPVEELKKSTVADKGAVGGKGNPIGA